MTTLKIFSILILSFVTVFGQSKPDKIKIIYNKYMINFNNNKEVIKNSDTLILFEKSEVEDLFLELQATITDEKLLSAFGIDTNYILKNKEEVLNLYDGFYKDKVIWNSHQKKYIYNKLTDINLLSNELEKYFSIGCDYSMHDSFRFEYLIYLMKDDKILNEYISKKSVWGYHFPYTNKNNKKVYNYEVDKKLNKLFKTNSNENEPLRGKELLKFIVRQIVNNNMQEIYKLSAFTFETEIKELETHFDIISFKEEYTRGRYILGEDAIRITLKNSIMLPNVYLQFLASKVKDSIYSRDSIKLHFKEIVSRIQSIPFILEYLEKDSSAILDIYYFNNRGVNDYNIEGVNKNPEKWKEHDIFIEQLNKYNNKNETANKTDVTIKNSEHNKCGCNYRFEREFIEKAIFFEVKSETNNSSIWYLLPNNTLLLNHVQSNSRSNPKVFHKYIRDYKVDLNLPWACLLFDEFGNLIPKK